MNKADTPQRINLAAIRERRDAAYNRGSVSPIVLEDVPALCDALEASQTEVERLRSVLRETYGALCSAVFVYGGTTKEMEPLYMSAMRNAKEAAKAILEEWEKETQ